MLRFTALTTWAASCLLLASCTPARAQVLLFADNFDAGTSAGNWSVLSHAGDYTADFAFDYSTRGIPSAPNSAGGSTVGLHFTVNNNDQNPAKDAVSAYPIGENFSGDYTLKFDMWMNYNGGPSGGPGSTEFASAGINHSGTQVCWPDNAGSDGFWFACTGEGGAGDDYVVYRNASLLSLAASGFAANSRNSSDKFFQYLFPSPTYETQGAPGKHWVEVEISQRGGVIEWRLNGRLFAIRLDTSATAGNLMLGYMDTYTSLANPAEDNFVIFDNVRVETPDCNSNGVADAQDLSAGTSHDCNGNGLLDDCEAAADGDFDVDGDVDSDDLEAFADGAAGPDNTPTPGDPPCAGLTLDAFDDDGDSDVDLHDYKALQLAKTAGVFAPRDNDAPTGRQFLAEIAGMSYSQRETRVSQEVLGGNVPGFMREFVPVTVNANIGGTPTTATYYVTPDYICIGLDRDFVRMPLTPLIAQPIADALGCLLPTRKMVDDIWAAAPIKLSPSPISPTTTDITLATTFYRHHETVEAQRGGQPLGPAIAGIKKDVVITPLLASNPGKVAIYGWHYTSGTPIQPLYLGHVDWYVDYSHGIRLVKQTMIVDGTQMSVADVLADADLHVLLSDEGVITNPSY